VTEESNREHWRRIDDARERSRQEGRRVFRELSRKLHESESASRRHAERARELAYEIRRREREEKLERYLGEMAEERASALSRISECSYYRKDRWYQRLEGLDVTRSDAGEELDDLLREVQSARNIWRSPELAPLPKFPGMPLTAESRRQLFGLHPVEFQLQEKDRKREMQRSLMEGELALVESALTVLRATKTLYESTRAGS
jgi:hypothetical protein